MRQAVSYLGPQLPQQAALLSALARWLQVRGAAAITADAVFCCCPSCRRLLSPCLGPPPAAQATLFTHANRPPSGLACLVILPTPHVLLAGLPLGAEEPCARAQALGGGPGGEACMGLFFFLSLPALSNPAVSTQLLDLRAHSASLHVVPAPCNRLNCLASLALPCPRLQGLLQPAELAAVVASEHPPLLALQVRRGGLCGARGWMLRGMQGCRR